MQEFYSNGKLLITGEYLVLDGAEALAVPTKFGQGLSVEKIESPFIIWESFDENHKLWFSCKLGLPDPTLTLLTDQSKTGQILQQILNETIKINPEFLNANSGFHIKTHLNFPRNWGLGTSSTLINNLAQWAEVNPFELLDHSFGGSGYDIACAQHNTPISYQVKNKEPRIEVVKFDPVFKDQLFFVYLNKKQNSRDGIKQYREFCGNISAIAEEISSLTNDFLKVEGLDVFEKLLMEHEKIISSVIQQRTVQKKLFSDYFGQVKSLGAWGGDFILATGNEDTPGYFKNKGFNTIIPYQEMIY